MSILVSELLIYKVYQKGNRTLEGSKSAQYSNIHKQFFHSSKDQAFSFWISVIVKYEQKLRTKSPFFYR